MTRLWNSFVRKMAPILSAGLLLQVGACSFDFQTTFQETLAAAMNNLITSFVFGAFNLSSGF